MRCNYTPTKEQEKAINKILAKEQKRIADELTEQARKRLAEELQKDLTEQRQRIAERMITITMWTLYSCFGFGKKRLERVKKEFSDECKRMLEFYEMGEGEYVKLCKYKLKDKLGIDISIDWGSGNEQNAETHGDMQEAERNLHKEES